MKEYSAEKISKIILEYADLNNNTILEIGCGTGRISSFLSEHTDLLVAIDPDEQSIMKARADIAGVDFQIGSGESLNFADNSFDVVLFTLSLHHQNSKKALYEAQRVVRSDGKILVIEPVPDGEIEKIFSFLQNEDKEKVYAQQCIHHSGLKIARSEIFTSGWVFDNEADLLNSVFEYYNMPFNYDIAQEISIYLGEKIQNSPIVCEDKMIIQSLYV